MKTVLILDTETTGLDPAKDRCIEVAVVRYSIEHSAIVEAYSTLIKAEANGAESVNHIPSALLQDGEHAERVWPMVEVVGATCDAVLAHNADFDRSFTPPDILDDIPWIDTCNGVTWPHESKPGASLISLALEHGLAVVDPHRALSDCLLLARLLTRVAEQHNIVELLARGLRPQATFQARVSYDDKDMAKSAGFHWDAPTKRWLRKMACADVQDLGFRVKPVEMTT